MKDISQIFHLFAFYQEIRIENCYEIMANRKSLQVFFIISRRHEILDLPFFHGNSEEERTKN